MTAIRPLTRAEEALLSALDEYVLYFSKLPNSAQRPHRIALSSGQLSTFAAIVKKRHASGLHMDPHSYRGYELYHNDGG